MKSIRRALLANLLSVFVVAWLLLSWAIWLVARHEIEEIFDAELAQSSGVIALLALEQLALPAGRELVLERSVYGHAYERNISFQIWDGERLVLRSQSAPDRRLCTRPGFADREVDQRAWRVSQRSSEDGRYTICAAESYAVRREMVTNITLSAIAPAVVLLPLVAVAVWIGIGRGLAPLERVTAEIGAREPDAFSPIDFAEAPVEVRPLTVAINDFLQRLRGAFERETRFTADAAHELRTPLASIKTQAQVALRASDPAERERALAQLVRAVDNGARLVDQLLTLARFEKLALEQQFEDFEPAVVLEQVAADLGALADARGVRIRVEVLHEEARLHGAPAAFGILVRNLVENAVRHSPAGAEVLIALRREDSATSLDVIDRGAGIPPAQRERVFERFFRASASGPGAGLGLAIVRRIADLHGAAVELADAPGGAGLLVRVRFGQHA